MGAVLTAGGFVGSGVGVWIFSLLKEIGQIDLVIGLCYVIFLSVIGGLMAWESMPSVVRSRTGKGPSASTARGPGRHTWIHGLPFKMRFHKSKLYISAIVPLVLGVLVGLLAAIMGVGGGFIMVPAMIYILGMPTQVAIGTSLLQIIFVTANTTFLQATVNQTVDVVLALILLVAGVIGAQVGTRIAVKLKSEQLRLLLALLVLGMAVNLAADLVIKPSELFSFAADIK
jgi:uncharacterized membrane protein YfcA